MKYTDEESRLTFHKSNSLLQLVCKMFESFCFLHVVEPEFIDLIEDNRALLGVPSIEVEQAHDIIEKMNQQFPRVDGFPTCKLLDDELNLFEILVTSSADLSQVN